MCLIYQALHSTSSWLHDDYRLHYDFRLHRNLYLEPEMLGSNSYYLQANESIWINLNSLPRNPPSMLPYPSRISLLWPRKYTSTLVLAFPQFTWYVKDLITRHLVRRKPHAFCMNNRAVTVSVKRLRRFKEDSFKAPQSSQKDSLKGPAKGSQIGTP